MLQGILNWKKCKECGKQFDIGIDYDKCPECRKEVKEDGNRIRI